jgi:hypothetical protein
MDRRNASRACNRLRKDVHRLETALRNDPGNAELKAAYDAAHAEWMRLLKSLWLSFRSGR